MKIKRISVRFNLDCDDDRMAWEVLHRLDDQSINKEIITRINAKEQADVLKEIIRQVVTEEIAKATKDGPAQLSLQQEQENCAEEIDDVFDFLNSF